MKRLNLLSILFSSLFFIACKKNKHTEIVEEPEVASTVTYSSYSAAKTGNYWIYEEFKVNSDGSYTSTNKFDSTYVEKDTVIRNNTYAKIRSKGSAVMFDVSLYQRDSLHYIINSYGNILFSSENFTTVLLDYYQIDQGQDTLFRSISKMTDRDKMITTPAGQFTTSNMQTIFHIMHAHLNPGITNPKFVDRRYAKNIGIISETTQFFVSSNDLYEKRLLRYHVN